MSRRTPARGLIICAAALLLGPVLMTEATADSKAALVRDVDTPALSPFRATANLSLASVNLQTLITTVPAGKRLVIESISYYAASGVGSQMVYAALKNGPNGPVVQQIPVSSPRLSGDANFIAQDGAFVTRAYFEPGESVWLIGLGTNLNVSSVIQIYLQGYYVTL